MRVVHVPPPDVEARTRRPTTTLVRGASRRPSSVAPLRGLRAGGAGEVQAAEEQRGVGEVGQRGDPLGQLGFQDGAVDPVAGDVGDVQGLGVGPHRAQRGAGGGEMGAFARQRVVGVRCGGSVGKHGEALPAADHPGVPARSGLITRVELGRPVADRAAPHRLRAREVGRRSILDPSPRRR
jgi:hypothetical protein